MTFGHREDPAQRLRAILREALPEDDPGADDLVGVPAGRHSRPPVVSMPLGLRERFTAVPHPVVLAFLVASLIAGAILGLRVARAEAGAQPIAPLASTSSTGAPGAVATGDGGGSARPSATDSGSLATVLVHVVGQVRSPGVVRVPAGARVLDAIEAAGGAGSKADLAAVNLARPVVDGEQVRVPKPGEDVPGAVGPTGGASSPGASAKVSLNTADLSALDSLPGVGPVLAQRILDWRAQNGKFASIDQLGEVSGIGEKLLAQLTPLVVL
ncbi:MAG: helix-hairpin-helix domain-containing protein [Actinobacteria bacterium]|uniref:ComEA family DNA-binding protein n=1 Tax=Nostocoides veronense TaxID=330836 RepID=A0ABN2LBL4_9MICO|nr:helix-hairpin-helix domain-containing protein [Actinomycetota bacterium]